MSATRGRALTRPAPELRGASLTDLGRGGLAANYRRRRPRGKARYEADVIVS